ncbi:MAG: pyridoxal phosphate-dependent aminotransferase [Saprospiraceae bacterium]
MFRTVTTSPTLQINTLSRELAAQGRDIIKFGFGQSPFLPPTGVIAALQGAADRKEYSSVQGSLELRQRIAKFHFDHNGLKVQPENILLAPGSKILLFSIMMAFEELDVLIPQPAWVSYAPQVKLLGQHPILVKTSFTQRWRATAENLRAAVQQKRYQSSLLILNYPGNPDGLSYSAEELQTITKVARELNIWVIADEIYGLLDFENQHQSLANFYPEGTITTTGLSKWCGAGGWRFGAAFLPDAIPVDFKRALIGIASETYSCAPVPVQVAAEAAYADYAKLADYLQYQLEILKEVGTYCATQLQSFGVKVHAPQGGFYIFPDFENHREKLAQAGIKTSGEFCKKLLSDTGVALLPGTAFGCSPEQLTARLAFVDFNEPADNEGFSWSKHGVRVKDGIERIGEWLAKW